MVSVLFIDSVDHSHIERLVDQPAQRFSACLARFRQLARLVICDVLFFDLLIGFLAVFNRCQLMATSVEH